MAFKIMFSVGEISADIHGGMLAKELKQLIPDAYLFGMGGKKMKEAGVDVKYDVTTMSSVGIVEYYDFYKELKKTSNNVYNLVLTEKPDLLILMDMEGFNLDLAKKIKHTKIPTLYYITPQRWVLKIIGRNFTKTLSKNVTKIITMFEEEQKIYEKLGANSIYLGNPIIDSVKPSKTPEEIKKEYKISHEEKLIGLLPGSRKQEIDNLTELFLNSALLINKKIKCHFIIPVSHKNYKNKIENISKKFISKNDLKLTIAEENSHNIINACDFLILSSGSATLEAAILDKPMVIVYKISKITYFLGRLLYKYDYIGLPNMIVNKNIVPELLQKKANSQKICEESLNILLDNNKIKNIKNEFSLLKEKLGNKGVVKKVAAEIINMLKNLN